MKPAEPILHLDGSLAIPTGVTESQGTVTYRYGHGLEAEANVTRCNGTEEWRWLLRNTGVEPSAAVTKFCPLVLRLSCRGRHAPVLHGCGGGLDSALFPPAAWANWSQTVTTEGLSWQAFVASSAGGRSSNKDLPFFVIEGIDGSGAYLGLGWSGDWQLSMAREGEVVTVAAGMTHLHLSLLPGESFSQPTVLVGRFTGDAARGQRALRRHLRDFVLPKLDGKAIPALTCWNNYYGDRGRFTEADALAETPRAAAAGLEYFILDGGWTGGGTDAQFQSLLPHIGSWRLCPQKFPGGWEPLKVAIGANGLKLGLWFDIERAHRDSLAYRERPELFSTEPASDGIHLLRLELDSAREWAFETLARVLRESGAQWVRFDFNSDPAPLWERADAPGRRGATEIRYIENLYRLWDELRAQFPALVIENCASGGRRIDLETLRRSHTDWISDHSQSEAIVRFHLHGAARWLPFSHLGTSMAHAFLEPNRPVDWSAPLPAAAYLSHFGGTFNVSDRLLSLSPDGLNALRDAIALYRNTAACFDGEVFPIGQQNAALGGPCGLAGIETSTRRRALVFFGAAPEARGHVPPEFLSLLDNQPRMGDGGSDQFTEAYLWADDAA